MQRRIGMAVVAFALLLPGAPAVARPLTIDGPGIPTLLSPTRPSAATTDPPQVTPPSTSPSTPEPRPVVVIDPGHSGRAITSRTTHGLRDVDYPNYPEIYETWDVSSCAAAALRSDGYRVVLTKKTVTASVSLTERARIADRAKAALAVSVHDDHSQGPDFQAVYSQRGVRENGRWPTMYRGAGRTRTVYRHPATASRSDAYAKTIAQARTQAAGRTVRMAQNDFTGRAGLEPGNLALVQLLSRTPWVYNEAGVSGGAMSVAAETAYAVGLVDGIERSVPTGTADGASRSAVQACLLRQLADRPARYRP